MCSVPSNAAYTGATKKVPVSLKSLWASGFNSPLEYVGTGECKDCFDWEKSAGKGKETEEWLSPGKQTDFCFRGEREDCLTDCLPAFSGSGWRTRRFQKLEKHTYTLVAKSDDVLFLTTLQVWLNYLNMRKLFHIQVKMSRCLSA